MTQKTPSRTGPLTDAECCALLTLLDAGPRWLSVHKVLHSLDDPSLNDVLLGATELECRFWVRIRRRRHYHPHWALTARGLAEMPADLDAVRAQHAAATAKREVAHAEQRRLRESAKNHHPWSLLLALGVRAYELDGESEAMKRHDMVIFDAVLQVAKRAGMTESDALRFRTELGHNGDSDAAVAMARAACTRVKCEDMHEALTPFGLAWLAPMAAH